MRKTFVVMLVLLLTFFTYTVYGDSNIKVYVDNQLLQLEDSPIIKDEYILVPMRDFCEALGATVYWEASTQTAVVKRDDTVVHIQVGNLSPTINDIEQRIAVTAQIINGKTYMPLYFVGEALGYNIEWDSATRTVFVKNFFPNSIENYSLEITDWYDENMPQNWSNDSWGKNDATFTYLNEGYVGYHSVKTEINNYEDGDAKWFFNPIRLVPGEDYLFSNYYKSNVDTRFVLAMTTNTGNIEYFELPNTPKSEDWKRYEAAFTMPKHGSFVTIYHLLSQDGFLIVDEYDIKPYSYKGFNDGLVTITFDDGWEENTKTALPIMQKFGYKSNHFYATDFIQNPWVENPKALIQLFIDDGHEIGSHSVTHPDLTRLSNEQVITELIYSKLFLESYLEVPIEHFSTPYGAYNTFVSENIMKNYTSHRTVDTGYNSRDNFDVSRLKVQNVLSSTTLDEVEAWVKKAKEEKTWLILLYHRVVSEPNLYDTTPEMFLEHMQIIKDASIPVVTISEALTEIESQLFQH